MPENLFFGGIISVRGPDPDNRWRASYMDSSLTIFGDSAAGVLLELMHVCGDDIRASLRRSVLEEAFTVRLTITSVEEAEICLLQTLWQSKNANKLETRGDAPVFIGTGLAQRYWKFSVGEKLYLVHKDRRVVKEDSTSRRG